MVAPQTPKGEVRRTCNAGQVCGNVVLSGDERSNHGHIIYATRGEEVVNVRAMKLRTSKRKGKDKHNEKCQNIHPWSYSTG